MTISIKHWLLAGAAGLLITACDSRLNVVPSQSIEQSQALNTEQDIQITLTGTYDGISDVNLYGGQIQYTGDLLGDNRDVVFGGTYAAIDEIYRKTVTTSNTYVRDMWLNGYDAINRANNVLSALPKVSAANRTNFEGQALFIRGALYFELVKAFAKSWNDGTPTSNPGIPLVLTPTTGISDADYRARNTVAEVYAQVISDLTKAESDLPATQSYTGAVSNGFATKGAAAAMLARVYLQQQNYAAARDAANRVITSGTYSLETNFSDVFNDGDNGVSKPEIIFKIIVTDQDGSNDLNTFYASALNQGRGDVRVQTKFRQLYASGDVRGTFFNTAGQNTFTSKFNNRYGDVPVVRLAEMYLIRAEANLRLNTAIGATPLADVNLIRSRAKATTLTSVDLAAILLERRLELAFEGQQLADVRRTAGTIGTVPYTANNLTLPIPQREIDTNKNLVQNPGY